MADSKIDNLYAEDYATQTNLLPIQERWLEAQKLRPASRTTGLTTVSLSFRPRRHGHPTLLDAAQLESYDFVPLQDCVVLALTEATFVDKASGDVCINSSFRAWGYDTPYRRFGGHRSTRILSWNMALPPRQSHQHGQLVKAAGTVRASREGQLTVVQKGAFVDLCVGFFDDDTPVIDHRFRLEDVQSGRVELVYGFEHDSVVEYEVVQANEPLAQIRQRLAWCTSGTADPLFDYPAEQIPQTDSPEFLRPGIDMYAHQLRAAFHKDVAVGDLSRLPIEAFVLVQPEQLRRVAANSDFLYTPFLVDDVLAAVGLEGLSRNHLGQTKPPMRLHIRANLQHVTPDEHGGRSAKIHAIGPYVGNPEFKQISFDDGSDQLVPANAPLFTHNSDGLITELLPDMQVFHTDVLGDYVPRQRYSDLMHMAEKAEPGFTELLTDFLLQVAIPAERVWQGRSGVLVPTAYFHDLRLLDEPTEYLNICAIRDYQTPEGHFLLPPDNVNDTDMFSLGRIPFHNGVPHNASRRRQNRFVKSESQDRETVSNR